MWQHFSHKDKAVSDVGPYIKQDADSRIPFCFVIYSDLYLRLTWRQATPIPTAPITNRWSVRNCSSFVMQPPCRVKDWHLKKNKTQDTTHSIVQTTMNSFSSFSFSICQKCAVHRPPPCRYWRDGLCCHNGGWRFYSSCQAPLYLQRDLMKCTHSSPSHGSCYCHSTWTGGVERGEQMGLVPIMQHS